MLDDVDLSKLATCADKAHERESNQNIMAAANVPQKDILQTLSKQVSELTKAIAAINKT